jgi:hypothetical protein
MLQFNSTGLGSVTPLGFYAGYLLAVSGNLWIAALFFAVTCLSVFLTACSLCRLMLNCRRPSSSLQQDARTLKRSRRQLRRGTGGILPARFPYS